MGHVLRAGGGSAQQGAHMAGLDGVQVMCVDARVEPVMPVKRLDAVE